MIEMRNAFHVGIRVADLDAAMDELRTALGVRWASPRTNELQPVWTPTAGEECVPLRYCYSVEGPLHLELVESSRGSFWDGSDMPGNHHVGVWVDDVAEEANRLISVGWSLKACRASPTGDGAYGVFAYLQPPTGMLVELVSRELLPKFQAWWAEE